MTTTDATIAVLEQRLSQLLRTIDLQRVDHCATPDPMLVGEYRRVYRLLDYHRKWQ